MCPTFWINNKFIKELNETYALWYNNDARIYTTKNFSVGHGCFELQYLLFKIKLLPKHNYYNINKTVSTFVLI